MSPSRTHVVVTGAATRPRLAGAPPPAPLPPPVAERLPRVERISQLALEAAADALAQAGLSADWPRRDRAGVVMGTAFGCFLTNAAHAERLRARGPQWTSPRQFAATVSNAAAGEVAIAFGLAGPGITLTAGAASGLVALGHAADLLAAGRADVVLAGGLDATGDALAAWTTAGGLDVGRPLAEAAALLVLESRDNARRRGVTVRAAVLGHAAGFVGALDAPGAADVLARVAGRACERAGVAPAALDVVVRAAPPGGNAMEAGVLRALVPAAVRVLSPKDEFGETLGAAGSLGLLVALQDAPVGAAVLVLDVCPSVHVAALVARAGDPG
jgi:3-oxoacyl-[acyl-carrier-protein] synthase II